MRCAEEIKGSHLLERGTVAFPHVEREPFRAGDSIIDVPLPPQPDPRTGLLTNTGITHEEGVRLRLIETLEPIGSADIDLEALQLFPVRIEEAIEGVVR